MAQISDPSQQYQQNSLKHHQTTSGDETGQDGGPRQSSEVQLNAQQDPNFPTLDMQQISKILSMKNEIFQIDLQRADWQKKTVIQ